MPFPVNQPLMAVLARQIATFRYEDALFTQLATRAGLKPAWFDLTSDRWSSKSSYKMSLLQPHFIEGQYENNAFKSSLFAMSPAVPLDADTRLDAITVFQDRWPDLGNPCSLVAFHHKQLLTCYPDGYHGDNTSWLSALGTARDYYPAFLSLFVAHCVLFEDFHRGESGDAGLEHFRLNVLWPAWAQVIQELKAEPIIVSLPWWPGLEFYPAGPDWRSHGVIPDSYLCRERA